MAGILVEGVSKQYDERVVLDDVTMNAPAGHLMTIVGPSGSGKTTLFRVILGEVTPDAGRILIDDEDVTDAPLHRRGLGSVYQTYALFPHMTVAENVAYGLRVRRLPENEIRDRVREMLDLVRLVDLEKKYPHFLSGGERQRVAVARALAVKPRALLLDEAFTALDATTRHQVLQEVRNIIKQLKLTTLLITHDQEEAFLFARRVLVMNEGKVLTVGNPEQIMTNTHPFIQDFVKMLMFKKANVEINELGRPQVVLDHRVKIPVDIPGVHEGDEVHVMIKKGPEQEAIRVWKRE